MAIDPTALPTGEDPFTRAQLMAAGRSRRTVDRWLSRGLIRPILYQVYVPSQVPDSIELRARAIGLVLPPGAVISRSTAAWLHGVDVRPPGQHTSIPVVECAIDTRAAAGVPIRRPGVRCTGARLDGDVTEVGGLPCTTPERTAADLLRWLPPFMGLGAVDAFAHLGLAEPADVGTVLSRFPGHRHVARARGLLSWCEPLTESFGESWLRLRLLEAGFPTPQAQVWVADARGVAVHRLDLAYPDRRVGIEYDGEEFHDDVRDRRHDALRRDRLAALGWTVVGVGRGEVLGASPRLELGVGELLSRSPRLPRRPW